MARYYEIETPEEVITDRGEFRYYPEAKKFQVSLAKWRTLKGEVMHGKTVTLDISDFKGNEKLKGLLEQIIADLEIS